MFVSRAVAAGSLTAAAAAVASWYWRDSTLALAGWVVPGAVAIPLWIAVDAVRVRRRRARSLAEQARLLEQERSTAASAAVDTERARIARELHDVISHTVSIMIIQTGAARQAMPDAPPDAAEAMLAVEASGREAMTELRRMLDLLAPAADVDLVPQPGLDRLHELVDRIAFAGLPVEVRIDGEPRPLSPGVDLTAYRVVQEALTNVLRHAPRSRAEVAVRYADRYLRLEILNTGPSLLSGGTDRPPPPDPAGRGLIGLRERVAVYGGDLDARRRLGGGYRVRARIPLDVP